MLVFIYRSTCSDKGVIWEVIYPGLEAFDFWQTMYVEESESPILTAILMKYEAETGAQGVLVWII